jgi:hypothetical protein
MAAENLAVGLRNVQAAKSNAQEQVSPLFLSPWCEQISKANSRTERGGRSMGAQVVLTVVTLLAAVYWVLGQSCASAEPHMADKASGGCLVSDPHAPTQVR